MKRILLALVVILVVAGILHNHRRAFFTYAVKQPELNTFPILTLGDKSPAVLTLHEELADLGYLPVAFEPFSNTEHVLSRSDSPAAGVWIWRYVNVPVQVTRIWNPIEYTEITKGAVMTFEKEHHLAIDGYAGPKVYRALKLAHDTQIVCQHPFTHVLVKQSIPQTLTIWQNGRVVLRSPCSTGVAKAPTHPGTHVIYLRNLNQKMEGETPWGTHYKVENVPYVSFFFNGEAIHGLKRSVYGIPQSVGCVELPIDKAKEVWQFTDYGTLVTVLDS